MLVSQRKISRSISSCPPHPLGDEDLVQGYSSIMTE